MEFPVYKWPRWKNVGLTIWQKVRAFIWQAGQVIVAISVILWVLASYGPGSRQDEAEARVRQSYTTNTPRPPRHYCRPGAPLLPPCASRVPTPASSAAASSPSSAP